MYQFVHSLSYTASIFILMVISTERYFAIIHPIKCKQILTPKRLVVSSSQYFEMGSPVLAQCYGPVNGKRGSQPLMTLKAIFPHSQ